MKQKSTFQSESDYLYKSEMSVCSSFRHSVIKTTATASNKASKEGISLKNSVHHNFTTTSNFNILCLNHSIHIHIDTTLNHYLILRLSSLVIINHIHLLENMSPNLTCLCLSEDLFCSWIARAQLMVGRHLITAADSPGCVSGMKRIQ